MKKTVKLVLSILIVIVGCLSSSAQSLVALADSAYTSGHYRDAVNLYDSIIAKDGASAAIYFNLGNSYHLLGDDGMAVVCYERALKLEPGNKTVSHNLRFMRNRVADQNLLLAKGKTVDTEPETPSFFRGMREWYAGSFTSDFWAWMALGSFLLMTAGVFLYFYSPNIRLRKTGFFSAIVLLVFSGLFLFFSFSAKSRFNDRERGVLLQKSELLDQPSEKGEVASPTPLCAGTAVTIVEEKAGVDSLMWRKVRLNPSYCGWVPADVVEPICTVESKK